MAHPYVELAKKAVETYIKKGEIISFLDKLPKEAFEKKAGTFVTIEKNGELRGCIGTYLPTKENIGKEIIYNAIAAATEDYRFGPIQKEELSSLSYTVYILSKPELVKDIKELDPKKYGIIVKTVPITYSNGTDVVFNSHFVPKSGLLLPDLEGVDTIEKQISIACQKGGIDPTREKILIYKFTAEKYQ
ncbi:MAG: AmmeMemoRadiSam system protein A [Patescibacteria group bacterium]|nr:AmmeMemoRadiSam system protein A [Patescibacteria group bacterium]